MSFQAILQPLIKDVEGAIGIIFVDADGEAVDHYSRIPEYDMKLLGAYKSIIIKNIQETSDRLELGGIREIVIFLDEAVLILSPVAEGYFLLLFMQPESNLGKGIMKLKDAIKKVREEL
ncbi:MAG: roadblock/LC7 domain-containing protein [Nitrospirota bacterium]